MNYFSVNWTDSNENEGRPNVCFFVDFPGYGYAKVAKSLRKNFGGFIEGFVEDRKQLSGIVLVCDVRREPEEEEIYLASVRGERPLFLALTKSDKLSGNERTEAKKRWSALRPTPNGIYFCSVLAKGGFQINQLRNDVLKLCSLPLQDEEEELE